MHSYMFQLSLPFWSSDCVGKASPAQFLIQLCSAEATKTLSTLWQHINIAYICSYISIEGSIHLFMSFSANLFKSLLSILEDGLFISNHSLRGGSQCIIILLLLTHPWFSMMIMVSPCLRSHLLHHWLPQSCGSPSRVCSWPEIILLAVMLLLIITFALN